MEQKEYSQFTDLELLDEDKKLKSFAMTNALFIGILGGIIIFSIFKNSWGMLTLIPLYFIYKLVNDPRNKKAEEIQRNLKERKLK